MDESNGRNLKEASQHNKRERHRARKTEGRSALPFFGRRTHTASMSKPIDQTARPPSLESIAAFVKMQRQFFGWKQDTLAALAGVSLSTVERVERGERVRDAQLQKLARALKREDDLFTRHVIPRTPEEALAALEHDWSWIEGRVPVDVSPLRKEAQLRAIASADMLLPTSDIGTEAEGALAELREWFDLASFIRLEQSGAIAGGSKVSMRPFYRDVLQCAQRIEANLRAVCLVGTYDACLTGFEHGPIPVAVLALRSRDSNPAAGKLRTLWADANFDFRGAMQVWTEEPQ